MAKAVLVVPRADMVTQAEKIAWKYDLDFLYMKEVNSAQAAGEAAQAVEAGAEMIIARGLSALEIKKAVQVPVVEITLTGQELGQLVVTVKEDLGLPVPRIGMIGFRNMFCELTSFNKLYKVDLHEYFVDTIDQLEQATRTAHQEGMDALIGGDTVMRIAKELGTPAYFLPSGAESIAEAFRVAEQVSHAIDMEKKNTALFKTLLDYSFNGIVRIGRNGEIEHVNHLVEKLLGLEENQLIGNPIRDHFPDIDQKTLEQVLQSGEEIYAQFMQLNQTAVIANLAPLRVGLEVQGAILSFQEGKRISEMEAEVRRGQYRSGNIVKWSFDRIVAESDASKELMARAKRYAACSAPVLIIGDDALEREMFAQCIHSGGIHASGPFIALSCDCLPDKDLADWIFGTDKPGATPHAPQGLMDLAEGGTLYLDQVSRLDTFAQYRLLHFLNTKSVMRNGAVRSHRAKVRLIVADARHLADCMSRDEFRPDLFNRLHALPLPIPPLTQRQPDMQRWLEVFIEEMEQQSERFIRLTSGALKILLEYPWTGQLTQMIGFCERLVTQAPRRSVDEITVRRLLQQSDDLFEKGDERPTSVPSGRVLADDIRELMKQHRGNRRKVAHDLDISTTTLWRYMKRYGIE